MIDEGKKWAKGKYPFTSAGLMRRLLRRINAEIPNHRGNSTVLCFQQLEGKTKLLSDLMIDSIARKLHIYIDNSLY